MDSIAAKVLRLASMRKPKRIEIRGDNAKMYRFLAKGGEDLRQDERILQVMGLINAFFAADAECATRNLHLRT
jgi:phosphatidylinositol kinase/protein kinase (PI-3  family)